jgi:hypothetical protein
MDAHTKSSALLSLNTSEETQTECFPHPPGWPRALLQYASEETLVTSKPAPIACANSLRRSAQDN